MNRNKSLFLLPVILLPLFLFVRFDKVFAQESAGFSVSPPSFEINAIPGDTLNNTIKIENLSEGPLKIQVKPQNFVAYGEGGQVALTEEDSSFSISKWIEIKNQSFTVTPKSFSLVNFTINIPRNAEPGSHYGAVVFSTVADKNVSGTGASLAQEIGSLILIKLPGDVFEEAKMISFSPQNKIFQDTKIAFNTLIENTGNIHVKPYGYISIYNILGQKVASIEVKGRNVLPGSRRLFTDLLQFKKIGYFRAEINLIYSGGGRIIKGETNFLAMNKKVLNKYLGLAGIIFFIYLIFRRRINKAFRVIFTGK